FEAELAASPAVRQVLDRPFGAFLSPADRAGVDAVRLLFGGAPLDFPADADAGTITAYLAAWWELWQPLAVGAGPFLVEWLIIGVHPVDGPPYELSDGALRLLIGMAEQEETARCLAALIDRRQGYFPALVHDDRLDDRWWARLGHWRPGLRGVVL